jgi:hypothetical protein
MAMAWMGLPLAACILPGGCPSADSAGLRDADGVLNGNLTIGEDGTVVAGETDESPDEGTGDPNSNGSGTGSGGSGDGTGSNGGGDAPPDAPPVDPPPPDDPPPGEGDNFEEPAEFSNFDVAAAIEAARATWSFTPAGYWIAGEVVIPSGFHRITSTLDLRSLAGLHLRGASPNAVIWADFGTNEASTIIDMTGSRMCRFTNIGIRGRAGIGLLLARHTHNGSAGTHRFDGMNIEGHFSRAGMVNVCSEVNLWTGCMFHNELPAPAVKICNFAPWPDVVVGSATMQNESYVGCIFNNYANDPNAVSIHIDNNAPAILSDISFTGGNVSMGNGSQSSAMRISILGQCQQITLSTMRFESETARNAIYIDSPPGQYADIVGLRVLGGSYHQLEAMLYAPHAQIAYCEFDGVFTAPIPLADWGSGGIRPLIWVKHNYRSEVDLGVNLVPPSPNYPWPPTHYVWAWGG